MGINSNINQGPRQPNYTAAWAAAENDTLRIYGSGNWIKRKEIRIDTAFTGSIRVQHENYGPTGTYWWSRVYVNGSAVGTSKWATSSFVMHSDDITGVFPANTLIQIYTDTDGSIQIRVFRISYHDGLISYTNTMT